jgi:hypothetical protein
VTPKALHLHRVARRLGDAIRDARPAPPPERRYHVVAMDFGPSEHPHASSTLAARHRRAGERHGGADPALSRRISSQRPRRSAAVTYATRRSGRCSASALSSASASATSCCCPRGPPTSSIPGTGGSTTGRPPDRAGRDHPAEPRVRVRRREPRGVARTTHLHLNDGTSEVLEGPRGARVQRPVPPRGRRRPHDRPLPLRAFHAAMARHRRRAMPRRVRTIHFVSLAARKPRRHRRDGSASRRRRVSVTSRTPRR